MRTLLGMVAALALVVPAFSRGPPPLPRAELDIHGLNRWTVHCLEMSRKRGVQTAGNGTSPSPCVARPEMSMADRLGSSERAAGATHSGRGHLLCGTK